MGNISHQAQAAGEGAAAGATAGSFTHRGVRGYDPNPGHVWCRQSQPPTAEGSYAVRAGVAVGPRGEQGEMCPDAGPPVLGGLSISAILPCCPTWILKRSAREGAAGSWRLSCRLWPMSPEGSSRSTERPVQESSWLRGDGVCESRSWHCMRRKTCGMPAPWPGCHSSGPTQGAVSTPGRSLQAHR